jgi:hypothetical protein
MARLAEKTPEFEGHPVGAASLPGGAMLGAPPNLVRGVPARPSRTFFIHEQRGQGSPYALSDRYRRAASVITQCAALTSLTSVPAAPPPAAGTCGGLA